MKVLSLISASALVVAINAENTSLIYGRLARDAELRGAKPTAVTHRNSRVLKSKAASEASTSDASIPPRFVVPVAEESMSMSTPTRFIVPAEFSLSLPESMSALGGAAEEIGTLSKGGKRRLQLGEDTSSTRTLKVEASMSMSMPSDFSMSIPATYMSLPAASMPAELSLSMPDIYMSVTAEISMSIPDVYMSVPAEISMSIPDVYTSVPAQVSLSMPATYMSISMPAELSMSMTSGYITEEEVAEEEVIAEEVVVFSKGSKRRLQLTARTLTAEASMSMSMPADLSLSMPAAYMSISMPAELSMSMPPGYIAEEEVAEEEVIAEEVVVFSKGSKRRLQLTARTLTEEASMSMSMPADLSLSMPATYMSMPAELSMSMPPAYIAEVEVVEDVAAGDVVVLSKGSKRRLMLSKATRAAAEASMSMSMPAGIVEAEFSLSTPSRFIVPADFSLSLSMVEVEVAEDVAVLSKGSKSSKR
jgi:hypothetical protein